MMNKSSAHSATTPVSWLLLFLAGVMPVGKLSAQEFITPEVGGQESDQGSNIGLYGFGTSLGWDTKDGGGIINVTGDFGNLLSDRVRLRPSVEVGFAEDVDTYVVSAEILYHFTQYTEKVTPYVGLGPALAGRDGCSDGPIGTIGCPEAWLQLVVGLEVGLRSNMNLRLEYHAAAHSPFRNSPALNRHRLFFGLSTRR